MLKADYHDKRDFREINTLRFSRLFLKLVMLSALHINPDVLAFDVRAIILIGALGLCHCACCSSTYQMS